MPPDDFDTQSLAPLLARIRAGEEAARNEVIVRSQRRLELLTRKMLRGFPAVGRWEDTDDVLQNALVRLLRALSVVTPQSTREFFALAAEQVRRELLDLARHYRGPCGIGHNHASGFYQLGEPGAPADAAPDALDWWAALHEAVERLPVEDREVFMLTFYHGWTRAQIAELFGVDERTVRRRWKSAEAALKAVLGSGHPPG